jgi:hypothetical protein
VPNAPYYLRYWIKGKEQYDTNKVEQHVELKRTFHTNSVHSIHKAEQVSQTDIPEGQVKMLVVASDGIESFMYKEEETYKTRYLDLLNTLRHSRANVSYDIPTPPQIKEINFLDLLKDVTDFKLTKGPFLNRRVKKVLKEHLKNGFVNDDDLSIGCFLED